MPCLYGIGIGIGIIMIQNQNSVNMVWHDNLIFFHD